MMLSRDLKYITVEEYEELNKRDEEIRRMLYSLIEKTKNKD